uniref:PLAT domain-containing protein n=1 Tax=Tetraselmis chuii TaxID=63592 RepID=A0A7S1X4Z9_9CHLO
MFTVEAEDVGQLQQLEVIQDGSGMGAAWLLASVEVHNRVTGVRTLFPCDAWLDKKHGMSRVLSPGRPRESSGCTYKLEIKTSDVKGAGTDANVSVIIFGDKGQAGPVKLTAKMTGQRRTNLFERNQLDVFTLKAR